MRPASLASAAALAFAATAAVAAPNPVWVQAPTVAEVAAAYPAKAKAARVAGEVAFTCTLNDRLAPRDCSLLKETPAGLGFAAAGRRLAEKLAAARGGGLGKGAEVRVAVSFPAGLIDGQPPVVKTPAWAQLPDAAAFQASFPKTQNGVNEVRVALLCDVQAGGVLSGCSVEREEPAGQGYGAGALALAPQFRVGPWSVDGEATVGAKVRVPIRYQLTQVKAP